MRRILASGMAFAMLATAAVLLVPAAGHARPVVARAPVTSDLTMVQANIYTGLSVPRFQADVATVLSLQPDFVTYNEVAFRHDEVLAPEGYSLYRDPTDRFTKSTPVAWRTDRWTAINQGSWKISDWRGKPPGRKVELGRRVVNWVTLQGVDGRVVSVVSAHVAPVVRGMPDLLRRSVTRLGQLVETLAPAGPVLVGGDFNVHYTGDRYPRDLLTAAGLVPTYDVMGTYFPTGDHRGATIDYVLGRGVEALAPVSQYPVELNSDHDAVVAGLSWTTDLRTTTRVVRNNPQGDWTAQRAVIRNLRTGLIKAPPGAVVRLATTRLDLGILVSQIDRAIARGVHVRVTTADHTVTGGEQRLSRLIAAHRDPGSWLHRAGGSQRAVWKMAGVPLGFMMVTDANRTWRTRYDANRGLAAPLYKEPSRLRISTGAVALQDGRRLLQVVGR